MKQLLGLLTILALFNSLAFAQVQIISDPNNAMISFASRDIAAACMSQDHSVKQKPLSELSNPASGIRLVVATMEDEAAKAILRNKGGALPSTLKPEGFSIRTSVQDGLTTYWVFGKGGTGAMYGGLELAEIIKNDNVGSIADGDHNPFMEKRGLKMNIPLDARVPSYADFGTAAQENIQEVWDLDFWKEQLDAMARNRYNTYTLWSLHPFPAMVDVKYFHDENLDDVYRLKPSHLPYRNNTYNTRGERSVDADVMDNLKLVKRMSLQEKIDHWKAVMQYGHDRGIEFHIYTWNVFLFPSWEKFDLMGQRLNWESFKNTAEYNKIINYFNEAVTKTMETYPLLAGFGVTAGEGFGKGEGDATDIEKEGFLAAAYGKAVYDYSKRTGRKIRFVHRQHQSTRSAIENNFQDLIDEPNIEFDYSLKYANAHVYAFAGKGQDRRNLKGIAENLPGDGKWWLNIRNDDIFNFRWGDYDFVKTFLTSVEPKSEVRGFHMGSDGYVWGREFADKEPESPRQLELNKHWLKFMLWGRLGYDPTTPETRFIEEAENRMPGIDGTKLLATWKTASKILPAVNRIHYHANDYMYHPEYNISTDLAEYGELKTTKGPRWHEISSFSGDEEELLTYAKEVLEALPGLRGKGNQEYRKTLDDLECWAHYGNSFAHRLSGNASLAAHHWRLYAGLASSLYTDQYLARVEYMPWKVGFQKALEEANGSLDSAAQTAGGVIYEAEDAKHNGQQRSDDESPRSYVDFSTLDKSQIAWTVDTAKAGEYILEFAYALSDGELSAAVQVGTNNVSGNIEFWTTSGDNTWFWIRKPVTLQEGSNKVKISSSGPLPRIDYLNLLGMQR